MADFKVIVNAAMDYQVVPFDSTNPAGFQDAGSEGSQENCGAFIYHIQHIQNGESSDIDINRVLRESLQDIGNSLQDFGNLGSSAALSH